MDSLLDTLGGIGDAVGNFITEKPLLTGAIAAGAVGAVGVGAVVVAKKRKKKTKKGTSRDRKFISKQKHERKKKRKTPGKIYKRKGLWLSRTKKAGSKKRKGAIRKRVGKVYYTKKGQPYKIMSTGKAKFIKKAKRGTR